MKTIKQVLNLIKMYRYVDWLVILFLLFF